MPCEAGNAFFWLKCWSVGAERAEAFYLQPD